VKLRSILWVKPLGSEEHLTSFFTANITYNVGKNVSRMRLSQNIHLLIIYADVKYKLSSPGKKFLILFGFSCTAKKFTASPILVFLVTVELMLILRILALCEFVPSPNEQC